ncbi:MAG: alpha/beta fold hydrolase [Hyphomicrobiaceae bacterium]|nr:alpha/beta fold hydrolase [Hyphomicrobiaceae bacterium]
MTSAATPPPKQTPPIRFALSTPAGDLELAARLDLPTGPPRAYALLVHGYTCSMDLAITRRIAEGLAGEGFAVLRIDLPGHGKSAGAFAEANFTAFRGAVLAAAELMRTRYEAPTILVGHSLGGAAILSAASEIPEAKAVATIGTPAKVADVVRLIGASPEDVRANGEADVEIDGHRFTIRRQFLEDAAAYDIEETLPRLRKALLLLHAPRDEIVGIDNAARLYSAARHPKSFVSLDHADHLLKDPRDAAYAARVIAAWSSRFLEEAPQPTPQGHDAVLVSEIGQGQFQNTVLAGRHRLFADEPVTVGGNDLGPSPYDYLAIALGACKSMTLRMYARHKGLDLGRISVNVRHGKVAADHCEDCGAVAEGRTGRIDRFECMIAIDGEVAPELRDRLVEIAGKCPVHKTLQQTAAIVTRVGDTHEPTEITPTGDAGNLDGQQAKPKS